MSDDEFWRTRAAYCGPPFEASDKWTTKQRCEGAGSCGTQLLVEQHDVHTAKRGGAAFRCPDCNTENVLAEPPPFEVQSYAVWKDRHAYVVDGARPGEPHGVFAGLEGATRAALAYSRSLQRWMDEEACWVEVLRAGMVETRVNYYRQSRAT